MHFTIDGLKFLTPDDALYKMSDNSNSNQYATPGLISDDLGVTFSCRIREEGGIKYIYVKEREISATDEVEVLSLFAFPNC